MKRHIKITALLLAIVAAVITGCIQIHEIIMPKDIQTNSTFEVHVKGSINPETDYGPEGLALAMLVPKAWNVSQTAKLYMSTQNLKTRFGVDDLVEEEMVEISDVPFAKPITGYAGLTWQQAYTLANGNMTNVGGDMEWLVFKNGTTSIAVNGGDQSTRIYVDVKIVFKTNDDPIKCDLAFEFAGEKEGWEGVGFKTNIKTAQCIVGDGTTNYLEYPLTSTVPSVWRYGDFFSVYFTSEAGGIKTALYGEKEVYMCGTAILEDGSKVVLDKKDASTKMNSVSNTTYMRYIFPRHYFGLPKTAKITDLYLYFTNKDGSKVVTSNDFPDGFQFKQHNR